MANSSIRILILATIACVLLAFTDKPAFAGRMDKREHKQNARIRAGAMSGELTKGEAQRARKQQRGIKRAEQRAEADGKVTKREKARIEKRQDKASRDIRRMKHNERKRGPVEGEGGFPRGGEGPGAADGADGEPIETEDENAPDLPPASDKL